jgi:hypothetical protein
VRVSTHAPLQKRSPVGHVPVMFAQLPPTHAWPVPHVFPHAPQFCAESSGTH